MVGLSAFLRMVEVVLPMLGMRRVQNSALRYVAVLAMAGNEARSSIKAIAVKSAR
jgi:hypothetical protein